jgi:hypothetical protein
MQKRIQMDTPTATRPADGTGARRAWLRPELQKLPIATTAGPVKTKGDFNEGQGQGKGDSGPTPVS